MVFGGFSKGKYFHDVHTLDVERLLWSQFIVTGTAPHGRVSHTATRVGEEVLIFGGSAGGACYNDVVVLSNQPAEPGKRTKRAEAEGPSSRGRRRSSSGPAKEAGSSAPGPSAPALKWSGLGDAARAAARPRALAAALAASDAAADAALLAAALAALAALGHGALPGALWRARAVQGRRAGPTGGAARRRSEARAARRQPAHPDDRGERE